MAREMRVFKVYLLVLALLLRAAQVAQTGAAMAEAAALAGPYVETVEDVIANFRTNLERQPIEQPASSPNPRVLESGDNDGNKESAKPTPTPRRLLWDNCALAL